MSAVPASRRLRELALWAGALVGLAAIVAGVAVAVGGFSFLVFRSGSMAPEIETGALAVTRSADAADIEPGDVVSVVAANGERVTHRVVTTTLHGDTTSLVLQGDANDTADSEIYVVGSTERVVASVPYGGYVVAHLLTPPGLVALGSLSLMLILLTGAGDVRDRSDSGARSKPQHRARVSVRRRAAAGGLVLAVVAGTGATLAHTTGTWATYTDRATAATGTFSAGTLAAPTNAGCVRGGLLGSSSSYTWSAPATPPSFDGYLISWTRTAPTGTDTVPLAATSTSWRPTAAGTYTVQIRTTRGSWSSPASASDTIVVGSFFGIATYSCQ